ncbi:MAG TPA: transglutaminase-like domain-containing protein [Holophagaceae bacterium]|jgi:transglutaminase-like putative cysteine protease|nr:transglutaminase-like domain-containing protein [Holophagaceae bacterium]
MPLRPLLAAAFSLVLSGQTTQYRQWMGGREVGGAEDVVESAEGVKTIRHREWVKLDRFGMEIRQDLAQTATKATDGSIAYTWSVKLSDMPLEGTASWSLSRPGTLSVLPSGGAAQAVAVPQGAILWPEDEDAALMKAAKSQTPLRFSSYSFPTATWALRDLKPAGLDPLPGFPDAMKFTGTDTEGGASAPVELWASPTAGELKEHSQLGGLDLWLQRAELPPPGGPEQTGLFDRSVQPLSPDPFRAWRPSVRARYEGGTAPDLPDTAQQKKTASATWTLNRAQLPNADEAAEMPVQGAPTPADARYLAATPLLQFNDPAFTGLLARMRPQPGLSRWQLAQAVTDFVFTFIREKDYSVGFASALEVCKNPKGDCTEHGVLAVALLRKLGVPARGVLGWVAIDRMLGMHFWVEVELKGRWVPVDPTLDEAPASAFHIALGSTDLANLGSLGWDRLMTALDGGTFVTLDETAPATAGNSVLAPDGTRLTWPGAKWTVEQGILLATTPDHGVHIVKARTRPIEAELKNARKLQGAHSRRNGWWDPKTRLLVMDLGHRRWLLVDRCAEAQAFMALDALEVH